MTPPFSPALQHFLSLAWPFRQLFYHSLFLGLFGLPFGRATRQILSPTFLFRRELDAQLALRPRAYEQSLRFQVVQPSPESSSKQCLPFVVLVSQSRARFSARSLEYAPQFAALYP